MNFSLYANMAGFFSNSCKYKIYFDGFTNEYVKHLCILLYNSYSASLWTMFCVLQYLFFCFRVVVSLIFMRKYGYYKILLLRRQATVLVCGVWG